MDNDAATGEWMELLQRATRGEEAAQSLLVTRSYDRVRAIVHRELQRGLRSNQRWMLPLFSTSDIVQDVLSDVVRSLHDCAFPNEAAFIGYLATAVRNQLMSAVRFHQAARRDGRRVKASVESDDPSAQTVSTPELAAQLAERASILRDVLGSFPHRHRALLEMRLVEEASFPEIATRLGYASAETARQSFCESQAKLVLRLRARGVAFDG